MKVIKRIEELSEAIIRYKKLGKKIGFVPTMGYLHEGHLSLVKKAVRDNDIVVVSIFVNPAQFGPKEDFKHYPRNLKRDQKLLRSVKTDILFAPTVHEIYPPGFRHYLQPGPLARYLCGPKRPGHFRGVVTVVRRLFDLVKPDRAYFGEKDYQQVRIIEAMVKTHRLKVLIRTRPIVREKGGLAMSSRNRYLSAENRPRALSLYQSLKKAEKLILKGEKNPVVVKKSIGFVLKDKVDKIDYIAIADPKTLKPVKKIKLPVLIALACFISPTRLIDNLVIKR